MVKNIRLLSQILFLGLFIFLMMQNNNGKWLIIFLVSLPVAALLGRVFCGWICPINTLMIPMDFIAKKLNLKRRDTPAFLKSGIWKWVMFILLISLMVARPFLGIHLNMLVLLTILGVLLTIWFKPEVWHNYLCPFGAFQSLTGRFAFFSNRVDLSTCTGCNRCQKVCPSSSIITDKQSKKVSINPRTCLQCFDCQEICPQQSIQYNTRNHSNTKSNDITFDKADKAAS